MIAVERLHLAYQKPPKWEVFGMLLVLALNGDLTGNRTPITALKRPCPNRQTIRPIFNFQIPNEPRIYLLTEAVHLFCFLCRFAHIKLSQVFRLGPLSQIQPLKGHYPSRQTIRPNTRSTITFFDKKAKNVIVIFAKIGEVAEWLKAPHSKRGKLARVSGVQISPSPHVEYLFFMLY